MKLILNKSDFNDVLLGPVSKLSDNLVLEFAQEGQNTVAKTLVTSADNSVILLGKVNCKAVDAFKCIIPDCKTFLRLFTGIEKENVTLDINSNVICYKDSGLSFKYHLLDESYVVNKKSISEEKLNSLSFDTYLRMSKQMFRISHRQNMKRFCYHFYKRFQLLELVCILLSKHKDSNHQLKYLVQLLNV